MLKTKRTLLWLVIIVAAGAGCKKKARVAAPPPPPSAPAAAAPAQSPAVPSAPAIFQFTAEPTSIQRGQSSTLRWQVTGDITSVSVDQGIGSVANVDRRSVSPRDSTTYTLTATGPGGSKTSSVSVSVISPPPPVTTPEAPPPPEPAPDVVRRLSAEAEDAYFDFDSSVIRSDAKEALTKDAQGVKTILGDFPMVTIVIEGHCDERGSAEFNLALSDQRAEAAKAALIELGVPAARLRIRGYGKERPQCTEQTEECWQKNRRVHLSASGER